MFNPGGFLRFERNAHNPFSICGYSFQNELGFQRDINPAAATSLSHATPQMKSRFLSAASHSDRVLVSPLCAADRGAFKHRCQILPCGAVLHGQHTAAVHADCHVPLYQNLRTVIQFAMCSPNSTSPGTVPENCTVSTTGIPAQIFSSVLVDIRIGNPVGEPGSKRTVPLGGRSSRCGHSEFSQCGADKSIDAEYCAPLSLNCSRISATSWRNWRSLNPGD